MSPERKVTIDKLQAIADEAKLTGELHVAMVLNTLIGALLNKAEDELMNVCTIFAKRQVQQIIAKKIREN